MKKKINKKTSRDIELKGEKKKLNIGMISLLVFNTGVIFGFYRYMLNFRYFEIVLISYMIILAVLVITYVIYNRGFSGTGITVEMLDDSMTDEEKNEFVEDAERRKSKSKWMIAFIFPFVFTFAIDAFSWFIEDNIITVLKGLK